MSQKTKTNSLKSFALFTSIHHMKTILLMDIYIIIVLFCHLIKYLSNNIKLASSFSNFTLCYDILQGIWYSSFHVLRNEDSVCHLMEYDH